MVNLPAWSILVLYCCAVLLAYLVLLPLVNDYTCSLLSENNIGSISRIAFQSIAGCWVPWS